MSLMLLGAFLVIVGVCDLLRAAADAVPRWRLALIATCGAVLTAVFLVWAAESWAAGLVLGVLLWVPLMAWVVGSTAALAGTAHARGWRTVAFVALGGGAVVAVLGASGLDDPVGWPRLVRGTVLAQWPAADVVVSGGAVLLQLATANVVVRMVLDAVGVPATMNEKKLKGGRLLGPMERLFIVGLGHIGEVTAAAIIVAAKGLLRFPELQAGAKEGPSDVTEYFLVGSLASWLIGLIGVALIYVA